MIDNSSDLLQQFVDVREGDDFEALHKIIHSLKGTSGTMGFVGVFEQSKLVEDDLMDNKKDLSGLNNTLFDRLQQLHEQSLMEVQGLNL